jgi:ABC-type uncharacterized transport system permease subunit
MAAAQSVARPRRSPRGLAAIILAAAIAAGLPALWIVYGERVGVSILASLIALTVPLLWAAIGECMSQKAGIINPGAEGAMLCGAFAAALASSLSGSIPLGLAAAIGAGLLYALVLGFLFFVRDTDQVVTGIQFTLLALGLTTLLHTVFLTGVGRGGGTVARIPLPLLSSIPVIGPSVFTQSPFVYGALAMALVTFYIMRRTWFGLSIAAVGERPGAADAAGINVARLRWIALGFECVMVAIAGAGLVLSITGLFNPGMTAGRGFIAMAVAMLASWNPLVVVGAAGLFGFATALEFQMQVLPGVKDVPKEVWLSLPYVIAIVVIAVARGADFPRAFGIPFERVGKRA